MFSSSVDHPAGDSNKSRKLSLKLTNFSIGTLSRGLGNYFAESFPWICSNFFTDDSSQAISIPEAPALIDVNGIPDKTTAVESGASYLTGKPLLVLNRENNYPDVNKWFLYYPLSKESDMQMP